MSTCRNCGENVKEHEKYCKACGTGLSGEGTDLKDKKARIMSEEKAWKKPAVIAAGLVIAVAVAWMAQGAYLYKKTGGHPIFAPRRDSSARLADAEMVKSGSGIVTIPLSALDDGKAHFFGYETAGKTVTFFVMKAADGSIRTAFDACMACNHAKLGYRQEGGFVVCNNCGMGFEPSAIGKVTGGCNPIPVEKSVDGNAVVLKAKDLEAGARYF